MSDERPTRWGFVGAGQMAGALVRGMIRAGVAPPDRIAAYDISKEASGRLAHETEIAPSDSLPDLSRDSDVMILAIKPQVMPSVLEALRPTTGPDRLAVSIAAGVTLRTLADGLGAGTRLVRVMPNTPALVGEGASGYCVGPGATDDDVRLVRTLLEAVGRAYLVSEPLLDAVTGLSGSGPAFVFAAIEALSDGGVRMGLPREVATGLAAQTVLGAARLVLDSGEHTGTLKDRVASPGGTTIAGLHALERGGMRAALMDAVEAATLRSVELGKAGD